VLALSTLCVPPDWTLPRAVAALRGIDVDGIALHRPPAAGETAELRRVLPASRLVAVFGDGPGAGAPAPLLVVEGVPAAADREQAILALLRRVHALRPLPVAVRAAPDPDGVPAAGELPLLLSELAALGYWHDASRAGDAYLDAAGGRLLGASFDPRGEADLAPLAGALGRARPAVVACPPGTPRREVEEAVRRARSWFRA
jgi:hypothetical protein